MAQSVKCLPPKKYKDLSSDPPKSHKMLGTMAHTCNNCLNLFLFACFVAVVFVLVVCLALQFGGVLLLFYFFLSGWCFISFSWLWEVLLLYWVFVLLRGRT